MDIKLIEEKQLVERWLRGKLSPPETRYFEQLVRGSPELAERLGLAESLQRTMKLLDDTGTEWREETPKFWHNALVPLGLAAALVLAVLIAVWGWVGRADMARRYGALQAEALKGILNVPTSSRTLHVHLARDEEAPTITAIGGRDHALFAELRLDVNYVKNTLFTVIIKSVDGTYWARVENLLRNSNGELLVAVNSSAFTAGDYEIEVRAVNLRGEGERIGRARVRVDLR
jgi:hypothetical protein